MLQKLFVLYARYFWAPCYAIYLVISCLSFPYEDIFFFFFFSMIRIELVTHSWVVKVDLSGSNSLLDCLTKGLNRDRLLNYFMNSSKFLTVSLVVSGSATYIYMVYSVLRM